MSKPVKRGDSWFIQFRKGAVSKSSSHATSAKAKAWHAQMLADYTAGKLGAVPDMPVSVLLERYAREISPRKRGCRWEVVRLKMIGRDPLADVRLPELDQPHIAQWRDRRLASVSGASVNREWILLSGVFRVAIEEWRMLERHPMKGVHKPANSKPRERLPTDDEIDRLRFVMGDSGETIISRVFLAFLFAIETGMRLGEIVALENVSGAVATLILTKNGDARKVPLSPTAQALWAANGPFRITAQQADIHFRKSVIKAEIVDLHFHDSRHLAITRLAQKLEILDLARAVGLRNLKQLMTYYNKPASEIAERLK